MADENTWAAERDALIAEHDTALAAVVAERDAAVTRYQDYRVRADLTQAISRAGGIPDILLPKIRATVKLTPDGDTVEVIGADGKPRVRPDGTLVAVDDVLDELRADEVWARGFKSSGATGGGAVGGSSTGTAGVNPWRAETINRTDQARLERADPQRAARLKAAARTK